MGLAEIKLMLYRMINKLFYAVKSIQRNKLRRSYSNELTDNRRYDFFIVWGHGLKHRKEIVDMIRNSKFLEIKMMMFYKIKSIRRFIKKIYGYDSAPLIYLRFKTKYLLNVDPNVYIIFVLNKNPQEVFFGKKPFRHIQCANIKKIKDEIRDRFNPRENGKRTENHIIHASDEQFQVDLLLKLLGFVNGIHHFEKKPSPFLSLPYHLFSFDSFKIKKINLSQLYCHILKGNPAHFTTEVCLLKESPHYRHLTGDIESYHKYLEAFGGYILTEDHSPENLDKLFQDSSYFQGPHKNSYILVEEFYPNKYIILDGVHRASKLLFLKEKALIVAVKKPTQPIRNYFSVPFLKIDDWFIALWQILRYSKKLMSWPKMMFIRLFRNLRMKQLKISSKTFQSDQKAGEYILSPSCQIANLGAVYKQYFGFRRDGLFVEVGAFDGEYVSNTSALADLGWSGFYIEPVPKFFELCKARHLRNKKVRVFNYAIGDDNESKNLYLAGPLSTLNPKMLDIFSHLQWAKNHVQGKKIEVKQITLDSFLTLNNVPKDFEVLIIDVEGYEWNVLKSFDIQKWKPKMVIIELHDQNDDYLALREECNQIVNYFETNKYKVIYKDKSNTIYAPSDLYPINNTLLKEIK